MANRFWVQGTGNWSDTAHWSESSGGAGGASKPTAADNVIFDTSSSTAEAAYTMTVNEAAYCLDFTMDGPSTTDATKVTWAGSSALNISGSLNLSGGTSGITASYTGGITFNATSGTRTIDWNGIESLTSITLNGSGGTFQLSNSITFGTNRAFTKTAGTFDANGKAVIFAGNGGHGISGTFTGSEAFYDLTLTGYASKTVNNVFSDDITVTHTLVIDGNSATNRMLVSSSVIGTPRTIDITGTTGNSFSNVDFKDINMVTGGADLDLSAITGGSGDCGGNSGITFTTGANMFWYKATTGAINWSTVNYWYLGTGGTGGAGRVPLPQDTAIFDDLSTTTTGYVFQQDMPRIPTTTFKGVDGLHPVANNPTFTTSTNCSFFGDILLTPNMTLTASTNTYLYEGRSLHYLESAGHTWAKNFHIGATNGGILKLLDDLVTTADINFYYGGSTGGEFDANDFNVTCNARRNGDPGGNKTIRMGNGTWTLTGYGATTYKAWDNDNGTYTIIPENSKIKLTDTSGTNIIFAGGNKVYNNIHFSRGASTGTITTIGANTFADLRDDGSAAHTIVFPNSTTNVASFDFDRNSSQIITLSRTGSSGTFTLNSTAAVNNFPYISVSNSVVDGGIYNAYHSTDGGNNTGWNFVGRGIAQNRVAASGRTLATGRILATGRTSL